MREQFKQGFSLMEMMVVLLIVAIIAAASAPLVSKKMSRNAGSGDSPWVFTGLNNSIAYNMNGSDASALIGTSRYNRGDNGPQYPRLVLASGNDGQHPAFAFADANGNFSGQINMNQTSGIVTLNNAAVGNNSTAIGMGQTIENSPSGIVAIGQGLSIASGSDDAIAIGNGVEAGALNAIAIGNNESNTEAGKTYASGESSIAIGHNTQAQAVDTIAIGDRATAETADTIAIGGRLIGSPNTTATNMYATAIGTSTTADGTGATALGSLSEATGEYSLALGYRAYANAKNASAIGYGARATVDNQMVLGGTSTTVYIPGNLIVEGGVWLGRSGSENNSKRVFLNVRDGRGLTYGMTWSDENHTKLTEFSKSQIDAIFNSSKFYTSDRRLKNVGEKYTAGLNELKQLDFFHYTFKKDEAKTPHVGVMAQDLEKVFPDAVTKGEDGYLRIRFEDMFYAVINAVKELDNKITEIVNNITQINAIDKKQNETIESMQATIDSQQKTIELLQKDNEELKSQKEIIAEQQKLIKKLEKRIEKLES